MAGCRPAAEQMGDQQGKWNGQREPGAEAGERPCQPGGHQCALALRCVAPRVRLETSARNFAGAIAADSSRR
jgi:hypothetical protein